MGSFFFFFFEVGGFVYVSYFVLLPFSFELELELSFTNVLFLTSDMFLLRASSYQVWSEFYLIMIT